MTAHTVELVRAWELELDLLEQHLAVGERLLEDPSAAQPEPWGVPDLGPMPESLLPRARHLLERQLRLRDSLARAVGANTRQRHFATRVTDATTAPAVPTYLDLHA